MAKRGRVAPPVSLTEEERNQLESYVRSRSMPSGLSTRFKIILLAADGMGNRRSAKRLACRDPPLENGESDTLKMVWKVCMTNCDQVARALFRMKRWLN